MQIETTKSYSSPISFCRVGNHGHGRYRWSKSHSQCMSICAHLLWRSKGKSSVSFSGYCKSWNSFGHPFHADIHVLGQNILRLHLSSWHDPRCCVCATWQESTETDSFD